MVERAPERGFGFRDITDEVASATPALDVVGDHHGPATVDGYTVAHDGGEPRYATVVATTPDGARVVARNDDTHLAADMVGTEWCGRDVTVEGDRFRVSA